MIFFFFLLDSHYQTRLSVCHSVSQAVSPAAGPCRKLIDASHISSSPASRPQQPLWRILETGGDILLVFQRLNKPSACLPLADPALVSCGHAVLPPSHHTGGFVLLKLPLVWKFSPHNPHKQNAT